ncbi:POU domain, class 6, transcription factor 2 isoform X1 [Salmo salar]|uniref:POU domain protein n=1 Tax=Salmo salar TaxID=8030 RepID=A0A1S3NCS9_SALSA|nr:POU domain, class 6, transcription factor 2-like isoform X1 [Salmo salar]|eukprot:XP_014013254.1 PREDICTED: POU domain, class 6, transcription factor 2-like isoform X1 [Salmo salar]
MITGQLSKPLLSLRSEMSAAELRAEDKAATPDSKLNDEPLLLSSEATGREDTPNKLYGARDGSVQSDASSSPSEQCHLGQSHPAYPVGPQCISLQSLLVAQQLAGGSPGLNQPILIPFNTGGHLGGQQGLVLSLPTANIQGLVAAAAAQGIMTLPLQNLQATSSLNSQLQHLQQLQQIQQHHHQQQQHHHQQHQHQHQHSHSHAHNQLSSRGRMTPPSLQQSSVSVPSPGSASSSTTSMTGSGQPPQSSPLRQNQSPARSLPSPVTPPMPLQLNPLASQAAVAAAAAAAAAAMGSIAGSQVFGNALSNLQAGVTGQLVTNAQGQIIGTIPLMPNSGGPSSQSGGGNPALQVQPITPQLLTNTQGQIIATVIGNQILPVINTQGITLSPIKPGQQLPQAQQVQTGPVSSQPNLLHMPHSQSPLRQVSSSSSSSSSSSALSVGQLVSNPQMAPSEVDGVNLEEIREFAKAFKIRRLSLGLTQTQVGQALSAAEGPAYSQSAICRHTILRSHFFLPQEAQENPIGSSLTGKLNPGLLYPARFEKLDITPKSAQKIKPVLERWMAEAEARHRSGMQNLTEFIGSEPSKKRKRRTSFTPQALEILNSHFEKNTHPSGQEMTEIAEKLNYDREVVRVWFCNKRQALKNTIKRLKQPGDLDLDLGPTVPMDPLSDSLDEIPK